MSGGLGGFNPLTPFNMGSQAFGVMGYPGSAGMGNYTNTVSSMSTPYSSITQSGVSLDPSIRSLQDQFLSQMGLGTNQYLSTLNDIQGRYLGNEGALVQAAVSPYQDAANQAIGSATQNFGLRGIGGSSFASDTLAGIGSDFADSISGAKAKAVAGNLGFETNLAGAGLSAQQQNASALDAVSQQRLQQELQSLGLGQSQQGLGLSAFNDYQTNMLNNMRLRQSFFGGLAGGLGGALGGIG